MDKKDKKPKSDKQGGNNTGNIMPWMWKKGQSGNPAGRPKGKTMKEYAREMLECMTDEERHEFMLGMPKETIWRMAEGNPDNKTDLSSGGKPLPITLNIISNKQDDGNADNSTDNKTGASVE